MTTRVFVLCFSLAVLTSAPSFAQERPRVEVSAGYDFLRLTGDGAQNLPSGWYGELALKITPSVAAVAEMTGHYQNLDPATLHTIGGGIRFQSQHPQAAPFGQVSVGVAMLNSNSIVSLPPNHTGPAPLGLRGSRDSAFLQVGAGIDLLRDSPIGIRLRGDFMRIGNDIGNMFRLAAGVVVPIGK
ncbi:MAG TPA: hypothetical protein VJM31_10400 [Vicinamibacterales bacterium]|nr:hypothetical protein [Vicinamibacterales bacterium]